MKAKEKAEMLVWKYSRALQIWNQENSLKAIQCALIAVDELIYETQFEVPNIRQRYWQEVKQEIKKL